MKCNEFSWCLRIAQKQAAALLPEKRRAVARLLWSRRDLPLYEPGGAGETLLGELAIAGLESMPR
jgi:hypothetical protein